MIVIFLSLPKMSFRFRTVYTIRNIRISRRIFAKKSSSKDSRSNRTSDMNSIKMIIMSLAPCVNCSSPSVGPACALAKDDRKIVRNANIPPFLFMIGLDC